MYRVLLAIFFLFCFRIGWAQIEVKGFVGSEDDHSPLPYATVGVTRTGQGTITNEDGEFVLKGLQISDTLEFRYLGFRSKQVSVNQFMREPSTYLAKEAVTIRPFTVLADGDILYDWLSKSARTLKKSVAKESRAFLELHTSVNGQPAEVIEMYYNASFSSGAIDDLDYKSGRQGLAPVLNSYFVSLSSSRVFQLFDLTDPDEMLPVNPLGLSRRNLKNTYSVSRLSTDSAAFLHLAFRPIDSTLNAFSGEIWIDKQSSAPAEVRLEIKHSNLHPFIPLAPEDSIGNVSMSFVQRFEDQGDYIQPVLSRFSYTLDSYRPLRKDKQSGSRQKNMSKHVKTDGIFYFYDTNPFDLPIFDFPPDVNDYQRIQSTPHNPLFWASNEILAKSERYRKSRAFFAKHGELRNNQTRGNRQFLENNNRFWSDTTVLFYRDRFIGENENAGKKDVVPLRDLYELDIKLYLDLVQTNSGLEPFSATVFDVYTSYFNLEPTQYTDAFINIAFGLGEIERRKLTEDLNLLGEVTPGSARELFSLHTQSLQNHLEEYEKDTRSGYRIEVLKTYNDFVDAELGKNFFEIFKVPNAE